MCVCLCVCVCVCVCVRVCRSWIYGIHSLRMYIKCRVYILPILLKILHARHLRK